jgi:hypothetical protein
VRGLLAITKYTHHWTATLATQKRLVCLYLDRETFTALFGISIPNPFYHTCTGRLPFTTQGWPVVLSMLNREAFTTPTRDIYVHTCTRSTALAARPGVSIFRQRAFTALFVIYMLTRAQVGYAHCKGACGVYI